MRVVNSSLIGPVCVALALTGCGAATAKASVNLSALGVHRSDVPRGFAREIGRSWSNVQAATRDRISPSVYATHGRERSYESAYTQVWAANEPPNGGLHRADSEITVYKTAAGARWGWQRTVRLWNHAFQVGATTLGSHAGQAAIHVPFKALPVPRIGNTTAGFSATWGGDEFAYTGTVLIVRQGRYVATVETVGYVGQVHTSLAVALARRIDSRIRRSAPSGVSTG
jgi:hypothetical protein